MKKRIKKCIIAFVLCALLIVGLMSSTANAGAVCMIKVPMNAQVVVKGTVLDDSKLVKVDTMTGRIHQIAAVETGIVYGYKQYMVSNLASVDDVQVYDDKQSILLPTAAAEGIIDYTGADPTFASGVIQRVHDAAVAYHNRAGYGVNSGFTSYFLQGSDAYVKAVNSDAGRKWGKFINPSGIASVEVSDICRYSDTAFTAKATITSNAVNGYVETYDLYMLFKHNGTNFYVTNFTFMP